MNEKGQLILTLVLVMTVALAIGLSIVQKSLVDVSTSTKVEQSSRAFSAAEAGVEQALNSGSASVSFGNSSQAQVTDSGKIPRIPLSGTRQDPFEYPPLAKEDVAQVWLADLNSTSNPPDRFYKQNSLEVYWGTSSTDRAALELTLVYYTGGQYSSQKWYLDHPITRNPANNFEPLPCTGYQVGTNTYQCKKVLDFSSITADPAAVLMLIRARLLYNSTSQPFAVWASWPCSLAGNACFIPPQARNIIATGVSGETQRRVQLFQIDKVVPAYFDYAIFSTGKIEK